MAESGDTGFLIGIGGFNMLDVAKQLSILENFSIPVYSIVNYYIRSLNFISHYIYLLNVQIMTWFKLYLRWDILFVSVL